jgi:hypothetical protein
LQGQYSGRAPNSTLVEEHSQLHGQMMDGRWSALLDISDLAEDNDITPEDAIEAVCGLRYALQLDELDQVVVDVVNTLELMSTRLSTILLSRQAAAPHQTSPLIRVSYSPTQREKQPGRQTVQHCPGTERRNQLSATWMIAIFQVLVNAMRTRLLLSYTRKIKADAVGWRLPSYVPGQEFIRLRPVIACHLTEQRLSSTKSL